MTLDDFFDAVEQHPDLEGVGVEGTALLVGYKPRCVKTRLEAQAVRDYSWEELEPVLTGKKEAHQLNHVTRVVGYFSRIENWNKSRQGELKDRHNGNYAIGGVA